MLPFFDYVLYDQLDGRKRSKYATEALEQFSRLGAVRLANHFQCNELLTAHRADFRDFFNRSQEYKDQFIVREAFRYFYGYQNPAGHPYELFGNMKRFKESDPEFSQEGPKPVNVPEFPQMMERHNVIIDQFQVIVLKFMDIIREHFQIQEEEFRLLLDDPLSILAVLNYPSDQTQQGLRLYEHRDYSLLTLVVTEGGDQSLELQLPTGEWVPMNDGSHEQGDSFHFYLLTGLVFDPLSQGAIRVCPHRVVHGTAARFSYVFTFNPNYNYRVKALSPWATSETEGAYPTVLEYLQEVSLTRMLGYRRNKN